jgi:hypothetical protein
VQKTQKRSGDFLSSGALLARRLRLPDRRIGGLKPADATRTPDTVFMNRLSFLCHQSLFAAIIL